MLAACGRSDGQPPAPPDLAGSAGAAVTVDTLLPAAPLARARVDRALFADATLDTAALRLVVDSAVRLPRLRSVLVAHRGRVVAERYLRGARPDRAANLKSASKSVLATQVGIALAGGAFRGTAQPITELLPDATAALDSAKRAITLGDLLSMRTGLRSVSFAGYGRWVSSRDWVRAALAEPVVEPTGTAGGGMIYSTGTTHLISAALTRATRGSTHAHAVRTLGRPLGIRIPPWTTDPQGISFGGNEMRMTPRDLLRLAETLRAEGRAPADAPEPGRAVVPAAWIDSMWTARGRSGYSGHAYGYGWWIRLAPGARAAHPVYFAWGYGGQFAFIVPGLELVLVTTSDPDVADRDRGHLGALHAALDGAVRAAGG